MPMSVFCLMRQDWRASRDASDGKFMIRKFGEHSFLLVDHGKNWLNTNWRAFPPVHDGRRRCVYTYIDLQGPFHIYIYI